MSGGYFQLHCPARVAQTGPFLLSRHHEPYKKPYNDALKDGFLAYMGLFSIIPVVLKVNTTQEAYPMKKDCFKMVFLGLTLH